MLHTIRELMEKAASSEKRTIAVAAAHDKEVLQAVFAARDQGVADAILTGDPERIAAFAKEHTGNNGWNAAWSAVQNALQAMLLSL